MSNAYQCDRCGEFDTATPNRYKLREYHRSSAIGWSNGETLHKLHLCGDCTGSLESTVEGWLDGPQEAINDAE